MSGLQLAACAALVVAGGVAGWQCWQGSGASPPSTDRTDGKPLRLASTARTAATATARGDIVRPPHGKRSSALEDLIARWDKVGIDAVGCPVGLDSQLSDDTVNTLLCGRDMLDLIEYLRAKKYFYAALSIEESLEVLLRTNRNPRARASLLETPDRAGAYHHRWFYWTGIGLPKADFDEFVSTLGQPEYTEHAKWVRSVMEGGDPQAALAGLLKLMPATGALDSVNGLDPLECVALRDLVAATPDAADFGALEELLPPDEEDATRNPVGRARKSFLERWAKRDLAAAASHLIDHPERFKPDHLAVIDSAVDRDPAAIQSCLERLAEDVARFDPLAHAAARQLSKHNMAEAVKIARRISDSGLRNSSILYCPHGVYIPGPPP